MKNYLSLLMVVCTMSMSAQVIKETEQLTHLHTLKHQSVFDEKKHPLTMSSKCNGDYHLMNLNTTEMRYSWQASQIGTVDTLRCLDTLLLFLAINIADTSVLMGRPFDEYVGIFLSKTLDCGNSISSYKSKTELILKEFCLKTWEGEQSKTKLFGIKFFIPDVPQGTYFILAGSPYRIYISK